MREPLQAVHVLQNKKQPGWNTDCFQRSALEKSFLLNYPQFVREPQVLQVLTVCKGRAHDLSYFCN